MVWLQNKEYEKIELEENYTETKSSIIKMFEIQERILDSQNNNIQIDATKCKDISSTCLAILSSIFLITKYKHIKISFVKGSELLTTLIENRFYKHKFKFNCKEKFNSNK